MRAAACLLIAAVLAATCLPQADGHRKSKLPHYTPEQIRRRISPSVVYISTGTEERRESVPDYGKFIPVTEKSSVGFFYRRKDVIATSLHNLVGARRIQIGDSTHRRTWKPIAIAYDKVSDLALIKVEGPGGTFLTGAPYRSTNGGEVALLWCSADVTKIGGACFDTVGQVIGRHREGRVPVLEVTAAVPMSGCPVIDSTGRLVAIVRQTLESDRAMPQDPGESMKGTQDLSFNHACPAFEALDWLFDQNWTPISEFLGSHRSSPTVQPPVKPNLVDGPHPEPLKPNPTSKPDPELTHLFGAWFDRVDLAQLRWRIAYGRFAVFPSTPPDWRPVGKACDEFRAAVGSSPERAAFSERAADSEIHLYLLDLRREALDSVAADRWAAEADLLQRRYPATWPLPDIQIQDQRFATALSAFVNCFTNDPWFDRISFRNALSPPVLAELYLPLAVRAVPDPDLPTGAYVGFSDKSSPLKEGDQVIGIASAGTEDWKPVGTWLDMIDFLRSNKADTCRVKVRRSGSEVVLVTGPLK